MKSLIGFGRRPFGKWLGIAALVLVGAAGTVMASHDFGDVPDTHPFHTQISNLVNAGITTGCDIGLYCPDSPVTRAQMAAFLGRGLGRATRAGCSGTIPTSETAASPCSITITPGLPAGAVASARQIIKAEAAVTVQLNDATGCPCTFRGALFLTGGSYLVPFYTDVTLTTVGQKAVLAMTGAIPVGPAAGPRTVEVRLFRNGGSGAASSFGNASASVFPYGGTGTNALGPTELLNVPSEFAEYLTPVTPESN